jgi:Polyketide cyclase / dehydrase and lipid transport
MAGTTEKSLLAVALFGIVLPHAGWTDGPSRQKITETILIDAPPAKVWATIADFHDMRWFPGVTKTTGEGGNVPDVAKRQLTLDGGAMIDESLYQYDVGSMSFARHGPPGSASRDLSCFRLLIADRSPIDPGTAS